MHLSALLVTLSGALLVVLPATIDAQDFRSYYMTSRQQTYARPACVRGILTFCEDVLNYPRRAIEALIPGLTVSRPRTRGVNIASFFTDESEGLDEPPEEMLYPLPRAHPGRRRGRRHLPRPANCGCGVKRRVQPTMALNAEGAWRQVLSAPPGQGIVTELCSSRNTADEDGASASLETTWTGQETAPNRNQIYSAVKLIAFDAQSSSLKEDFFIMPTCCRCVS